MREGGIRYAPSSLPFCFHVRVRQRTVGRRGRGVMYRVIRKWVLGVAVKATASAVARRNDCATGPGPPLVRARPFNKVRKKITPADAPLLITLRTARTKIAPAV